jgi:transcriptional regulator with PAS, ATPase and Fis domain
MKKDMNELKILVNDIIRQNPHVKINDCGTQIINNDFQPEIKYDLTNRFYPTESKISDNNIEETGEIIEEVLSLSEQEKELIIKALEKYNSKRKLAADELGISERTLYRKIKEYNIDK